MMNDEDQLMYEDLSVAQSGTGNAVARARWKQGYKTGQRVMKEQMLNIIFADAHRYAVQFKRTADIHAEIIVALKKGLEK